MGGLESILMVTAGARHANHFFDTEEPPCKRLNVWGLLPPLTKSPWRKPSNWDDRLQEELLRDIRQLNPAQKPSLLLVGPVGAGKSSFINAILSIGKGRKVDRAQTGSSKKSYTTNYEKFTERSLLQRYSLRDCMGIEPTENEGFHVDDMVMLLKGHVKDGYMFNPRSPISESDRQHYRPNPTFENQTHCVVFVVDSQAVYAGIPAAYVAKIAQLQEKIKQLRIPRVLLLTKVDKLCAEVERDVSLMFRSVRVRDAVMTAAEVFHIPEACIHPVKNYEVDIMLNTKTNIPILLALRQMMQYADDRVDEVLNHSDSDDDSD